MREIKFRAWNKAKKIMVYEDEDNESDYWDGVEGNEVEILNYRLSTSGEYEWLQYTAGLKDKNGKEIYEGDIVAERTMGGINYSVVKFGEINISKQACKEKPCICFYNDYSNFNDNWADEPLINTERFEVIGNIYENPELLESEENE